MPTSNPVPSYDPSDLIFNAEKLDQVVNSAAQTYTDRMGAQRRTLAGLEAEFPNAAANAAAAEAARNAAQAAATQAGNEADSAATAVDLAFSEATAAQAARTGAEAARDAATVNANAYTSTAAGLAAVTDGQQFQVVSVDEIIRYVRTNSTTATEVARYPSADLVNGVIRKLQPGSGYLGIFADSEGWSKAVLHEDGTLETTGYTLEATTDALMVVDKDGWVAFDAQDIQATAASANSQPWANKKFLLFGDSITQTADVQNGQFEFGYSQNWPVYAYTELQMAKIRNYARSGASYREYAGQLDWQKISHQVTTAIENTESPDIIIIACGTNDGIGFLGSYATAMGKATQSDLDRSLTLEAVRWALWKIKEAWPGAMCFLSTPTQRADVETATRASLYDGLAQMAKRYGFIVLDAHSESGIVKDFEVWGSNGRYLVDGLHHNTSGQQVMSKFVSSVIKSRINQ